MRMRNETSVGRVRYDGRTRFSFWLLSPLLRPFVGVSGDTNTGGATNKDGFCEEAHFQKRTGGVQSKGTRRRRVRRRVRRRNPVTFY